MPADLQAFYVMEKVNMSREPVVKNGVVSVPSNYSVAESMNRVEKAIIGMGLNVFARI
jgi:uncharacterized protein (DUF302 family)